MLDNNDIQKAIDLLDKSSRILVLTHFKPDGDACGCVAAMCDVLRARGKTLQPLFLSPVPESYAFLFDEKTPILGQDVPPEHLLRGQFGPFDLILILDTNSYSQLAGCEEYLKTVDLPILVIDHHLTSDSLGDVEIEDSTAAATGLVLHDLLKEAAWPINRRIAEALFVAIAADTGWFHFSNTDSRVYRICAELIEHGVDPARMYERLYQTFSAARLRLMTAMLNTLELQFDGRYAAQQITQHDFQQTGATYADTENLIDECRRIGSVIVAALFVELKDGRIRCSLRSKEAVDVSAIAAEFGGGGHRNAAGTYLPGPMENAKRLIETEVGKYLKT